MTKREKVMRALELCSTTKERIARGETIARKACADCPYNHENCEDMARDALELLTKDEYPAQIVIWQGEDMSQWYACEACDKAVSPGDKYCRECGRELKWNE